MTRERSSGSRRTVLAASLAATAGLVGGMALKTVGPSPSSASTAVTNATTPSVADQRATGVWVDRDDDHDDDEGRVFQHAAPSSDGGSGSGGSGPVVSSHGS